MQQRGLTPFGVLAVLLNLVLPSEPVTEPVANRFSRLSSVNHDWQAVGLVGIGAHFALLGDSTASMLEQHPSGAESVWMGN